MSSLAGSNSFRQALVTGQVDIGMEYTGTAWITYLNHEKGIADQQKQYEAVRDADLAVQPGEFVGYSATWTADAPRRIARKVASAIRDDSTAMSQAATRPMPPA